MKSLLVVLLLISFVLSYEVTYEGYIVYSVKPVNDVHRLLLSKWQEKLGIDFWEPLGVVGKPLRIMVAPNIQTSFLDAMKSNDIPHELIIKNVEETIQMENTLQLKAFERIAKLRSAGNYATEFTHFWTIDEINNYLTSLTTSHGDICKSIVAGTSYNGKLIHALQISIRGRGEITGDRPIVFVDAGIHAREWAAPMTAIYAIHEMVELRSFDDVLQNVDIIILPVVNPDGYEFTHQGNRFWRKTRRPSNLLCYGTDGNRNYGFQWQPLSSPCSDTYSGTGPFSESETQAVRSIIQKYGSQIKLYISFHSYGNYVLYPWGYDEILIDNWQHHDELGHIFANAVRNATGTEYDVGNSAILLYYVPGGSDDYAASEDVVAAFTIELPGGGTGGFDLPVERLLPVVQETWQGFSRMVDFVSRNN